jgi:flagella basal body P-ring formation protein FlgA
MHKPIAALFAALVGAQAVAQVEPAVRIEMRPVFDAASEHVVLGDLAIIHARDLETMRQLVTLSLGERPAAGGEALVRREAIARWVRSRTGIARNDVEWGGAAETIVRTPAQQWHASRLEQVAQQTLNAWIAQNAPGYRAELVPLSTDLRLPAGNVTVSARPIAANIDADRRVTVWLDVAVDARNVRSVPVGFEMTATVAAARAAAAAAPLVARGEWVELHMKSGGLEVQARVQALQDGAAGQVVQVRASAAGAPVSARVVAAGQVEGLL